MLSEIKKILPAPLRRALRALWHPLASLVSALATGFPARHITVIGVNGTKGKSTTAEMLFATLEGAGYETALASTIRFAIGKDSRPNLFKMTMPGRGWLQRFLRKARNAGATHAVVELTTEGAREWRHRFLALDALIMLNVQREHIESFGSFENYINAKGWLVKELERSRKKNRAVVVNADDERNAQFLRADVPHRISFSNADIANVVSNETETSFVYKNVHFTIPLPGTFNAMNALSVIKTAEHLGVSLDVCARALRGMAQVKGRLEPVRRGQPFMVIVDYAHTPDSLEALYGAFQPVRQTSGPRLRDSDSRRSIPKRKLTCVLGNTGGGRDTWKRPLMGAIADEACDTVILTNEDPYDEDPRKIVDEMARGMKRAPVIEMDRRKAIALALRKAEPNDVVLISGKGTDPYIMEAGGKKTMWSDAEVAGEELEKLGYRSEARE